MWQAEHSIEASTSPGQVWRMWEDVAGWPAWNAGVAKIELNGPFATGSTFDMELPDGTTVSSALAEVDPGIGFVDETRMDDIVVRVAHTCSPLDDNRVLISYLTTVTGPEAAEVGAMVTADFPDVLAALKAQAEATDHGGERG